NLYPDLSE
nr:Chain B, p6-Gag [synthetic construct]